MEIENKISAKPKSKWLFPLLLVVGIIFLGLGIWAGYNHWNKLKTSQQPTEEEQNNEFTDWQTYQSNEFGIEIKYPLNFLIGEPIIIGGNCDYQGFPEKCPNIDNILIQNNLELTENLKYPNYWSIKPIKVNYSANGNNFCLFSTNDVAAGTMYQANYYATVKNNQCVILRLVVPYPNCGNYADEAGISKCEQDNLDKPQKVDQILSTFKFIEPSDISDWQTYRNEEYGFEFKYLTDSVKSVEESQSEFDGEIDGLFVVIIEPSISMEIAKSKYNNINEWMEEIKREHKTNLDAYGCGYEGDERECTKEDYEYIQSIETIKVQDKNWTKVNVSGGPYGRDLIAAIINNDYFYTITHWAYPGDMAGRRLIFDQILSTFKFIEPKK